VTPGPLLKSDVTPCDAVKLVFRALWPERDWLIARYGRYTFSTRWRHLFDAAARPEKSSAARGLNIAGREESDPRSHTKGTTTDPRTHMHPARRASATLWRQCAVRCCSMCYNPRQAPFHHAVSCASHRRRAGRITGTHAPATRFQCGVVSSHQATGTIL
jgi:hypothetical protein